MNEGTPIKQDIKPCAGCGKPIIFVQTAASVIAGKPKWIPLDARTERRMIINAEHKAESITTWTPHHATCSKVEDFR